VRHKEEFMMKNLLIFGFISMSAFCYSEVTVETADLEDSQTYKVDKGVEEMVNERSLAGSKIKKNKLQENDLNESSEPIERDAEVRYWEYSE
jgi:hypothetical protein